MRTAVLSRRGHLLKTITPKEDRSLLSIMRQNSFLSSPKLTLHHHRGSHMLAHRHQNWNHRHWSHVFFADGSIDSLYSCNRHARVFRRVVESLVDCCIHQMDFAGTTTRDPGLNIEYRMRPVLIVPAWRPVCQHVAAAMMSIGLSGALVWMSRRKSSCYWTSSGRADKDRLPNSLILDAERKLFRLMIQKRAWSSFDVIVFNRYPRSPCIRLLLSRTFRWHLLTLR